MWQNRGTLVFPPSRNPANRLLLTIDRRLTVLPLFEKLQPTPGLSVALESVIGVGLPSPNLEQAVI